MLTRKQHELLVFINDHLGKSGVSPSFDEMKDALKLKSKSGIHRLITGLEERGFIRRLAHRARALEVVRMPETAAYGSRAEAPAANRKFQPNVIKGSFRNNLTGKSVAPVTSAAANSNVVELPLYGRIAAGTPIEALRDTSNHIDVPASMLGRGDHYA
ncbi:MAG: LexA family protein, partial [Alphaproteobacteria bacterium]